MQVFLYLDILEEIFLDNFSLSYSYPKTLSDFVKNDFPNVFIFDLDNFSETAIVQNLLLIMENAEKVIIVIESQGNGKLQSLLALIERAIRNKEKYRLIVNGEHALLEKMLKVLDEKYIRRNLDLDAQKKAVSEWLKS